MIHPGLQGGEENAKTFQRKIWIVLLRGAEEGAGCNSGGESYSVPKLFMNKSLNK